MLQRVNEALLYLEIFTNVAKFVLNFVTITTTWRSKV